MSVYVPDTLQPIKSLFHCYDIISFPGAFVPHSEEGYIPSNYVTEKKSGNLVQFV